MRSPRHLALRPFPSASLVRNLLRANREIAPQFAGQDWGQERDWPLVSANSASRLSDC